MYYEDSSDLFWKLISILTLPIEKQINIIGKLPEKQFKDPYITNLYLFHCSLETYIGSWIDEFDFLYIDEQPSALYKDFIEAIDTIDYTDCLTTQDFIKNRKWNHLRALAKEFLAKSGLPAIEIQEFVNFGEYVRVFINEYGDIQHD